MEYTSLLRALSMKCCIARMSYVTRRITSRICKNTQNSLCQYILFKEMWHLIEKMDIYTVPCVHMTLETMYIVYLASQINASISLLLRCDSYTFSQDYLICWIWCWIDEMVILHVLNCLCKLSGQDKMVVCINYRLQWYKYRYTGQTINILHHINPNIFINIWFAIRRLNKYILYCKCFLRARRPPKVRWNVQMKRWHETPRIPVFTKHENIFTTSDILTTVFLINIGHFCEPVDKNYRLEFWKWKCLHQLRKAWKYEWAIVILTVQFLLPNWSLTWIVSLFHTCLKNGPIWSLITTKNIVLLSKCWQKWLPRSNFSKESRTLWNSHICAKKRKCLVYMSTMARSCSFNTVHHKVVDFIHF